MAPTLLTTVLLSMALVWIPSSSAWDDLDEPPLTAPICKGIATTPGCKRFVTGFDLTGTTDEIDLTRNKFHKNGVPDVCSCIEKCKAAANTCVAWVWKFTGSQGTYRNCTLYSNFNLPLDVNQQILDVQHGEHAAPKQGNPQAGALITPCTDPSGNNPDPHCASGFIWKLAAADKPKNPDSTASDYIC